LSSPVAFWRPIGAPEIFLIDDGGWWHIGLLVAIILLGLSFRDLYENYHIGSRILLIQQFSAWCWASSSSSRRS